ncbi:unnamed protein product [marine sediment metagenome]|uniref:Uncharacterized protein n=1 Tax=marine sediment metagenome TaxID=412755 RepID=X1PP61_9ZZZZ
MTKQEEIRKGIFQMVLPRVCRLRPEIDIKGAQQAQLLVDELWNYLHSQGVVIKVERELPEVLTNNIGCMTVGWLIF